MSVASVVCWWCKKVIPFIKNKPAEPYTFRMTTRKTRQLTYPHKEGTKRDHAPICLECEKQEKQNGKKA